MRKPAGLLTAIVAGTVIAGTALLSADPVSISPSTHPSSAPYVPTPAPPRRGIERGQPPPVPKDIIAWVNPTQSPRRIVGQVIGADDLPVERVLIRVIRLATRSLGAQPSSHPPDEVIAEAWTNPDGKYRIELPPFNSSLLLQIQQPGFYSARRIASGENSTTLRPSDDGTLQINARLTPLGALAGQILLPDNSPAANVQVSASMAIPNREFILREVFRPEVENTRTDSHGRFAFERQPTGPVWIYGGTLSGPGIRTVVEAPQTSLRLSLAPRNSSVKGRVMHHPEDTPLSGTRVSLTRVHEAGATRFFDLESTTTDAAGHYSFDSLFPGNYTLYAQRHNDLFPFPGAPMHRTLQTGEDASVPDIGLFSGYELRLRVYEAGTSNPVEGALITVNETEHRTDAGGQFIVRNNPPQGTDTSVHVQIHKPGYRAPGSGEVISELVPLATDALVTLHNFELLPLSVIRGSVRTRAGVPIPNARVGLERAFRTGENPYPSVEMMSWATPDSVSGQEGRFEVGAVPSASLVRLHASAPGYAWTVSDPIAVGTEPVEDAEILMAKGASVSGTVVGGDGAGIPGAVVTTTLFVPIADLTRHGQQKAFTTTAQSDGTFTLSNLPADKPLVLRAQLAGQPVMPEIKMTLKDGESTTGLRLVLSTMAN